MPHLIVQATPNVTIRHPESLLKALNTTLWQSGQFKQPEDIKARMLDVETFLVGMDDDQQERGFVSVELRLMPGRSEAVKNTLAASLLACLQAELSAAMSNRVKVQCCVEVLELNTVYHKAMLSVDSAE